MHPPSLQLLRILRAVEKSHVSLQTSQPTLRIGRRPLGPSRGCQLKTFGKNRCSAHCFSTSTTCTSSPIPKTSDRGPVSSEDTQTDFGSMNVLGNTPAPTTAIDACLHDGFHLDNGLKISGGSGCLLVAGEAFSWRPWDAGSRGKSVEKGRMINMKGQWDVEKEAWGVLDLMWPKPGMKRYPFSSPTAVLAYSPRGQRRLLPV